MHPRLLPGMWHADLCHTIRAAPVRLSAGARCDRPARTIWATVAANLVLFGATLVDGFARHGSRTRMTARRLLTDCASIGGSRMLRLTEPHNGQHRLAIGGSV